MLELTNSSHIVLQSWNTWAGLSVWVVCKLKMQKAKHTLLVIIFAEEKIYRNVIGILKENIFLWVQIGQKAAGSSFLAYQCWDIVQNHNGSLKIARMPALRKWISIKFSNQDHINNQNLQVQAFFYIWTHEYFICFKGQLFTFLVFLESRVHHFWISLWCTYLVLQPLIHVLYLAYRASFVIIKCTYDNMFGSQIALLPLWDLQISRFGW